MKKSNLSTRSLRFQIWKQLILAILLITAVVYLYDGYKRTRRSALECYSIQQTIYADQIVNEVRFRFELIGNVLELWSSSGEILHMSDETLPSMERILAAHGSYISGVTRMDENGIIRVAVPFYEGTIGADISYQEHIQQLMETHCAVLSDAFMTVQGYWAIVYHVPCFDKENSFRGSLAFLVPFREMFRKLFIQLLPEGSTIPLVLGSDGLILFSPQEEHEGRHYTEVFSVDSGEMNVADAAFAGTTGYML
ncbi:MAG: cache domain-containing protein, partial [Candidatus Aegiribacteria sp.]|nr:cache domain-containing protein [Candidatus Aegiribacteria sp.]